MPELIYPVYLSIANFRHAARSIFPLPVRGIDSIWRMCFGRWYLGNIPNIISSSSEKRLFSGNERDCSPIREEAVFLLGKWSFPVVINKIIASPNFGSGTDVMAKLVGMMGRKISSTISVCIFMPPLLMMLSFLPKMRKRPSGSSSATSLVLAQAATGRTSIRSTMTRPTTRSSSPRATSPPSSRSAATRR